MKLSEHLNLITFSDIAIRYLDYLGYEAIICEDEQEARKSAESLIIQKKWPCYFFKSDTTGEKGFEEFYTDQEDLDLKRFSGIGVIKNEPNFDSEKLDKFIDMTDNLRNKSLWNKKEILDLFYDLLPDFTHLETGKNLDEKM